MSEVNCVTVTGPSGCGKTTLARWLVEERGFKVPRSAVTRPRRDGEDNAEYEFMSVDEWRRREAAGEFIEKTQYGHNLYAMFRSEFESHPKMVSVLDRNGVGQIRAALPDRVFSVLLLPPSLATLRRRMSARGDKYSVIRVRMEDAVAETTLDEMFDYVVVNDSIHGACRKVYAAWERWCDEG